MGSRLDADQAVRKSAIPQLNTVLWTPNGVGGPIWTPIHNFGARSPTTDVAMLAAFRRGLSESNYREGSGATPTQTPVHAFITRASRWYCSTACGISLKLSAKVAGFVTDY